MVVDVDDEIAIDLEDVGRQFLQVRERSVAGAEIVQRDLDAEIAHLVDEAAGVVEVVQGHAFGDFHAQPAGDVDVTPQDVDRILDEALVVERGARQVHADELGVRQAGEVLLDPAQGGGQHPAVDHAGAPTFFGRRDDGAGRRHAAVALAHAQQHFEVERLVRCLERHDGLHFEEHSFGRVRRRQLRHQG